MLQSINKTKNRVRDLIDRYDRFTENEVEQVLKPRAQGHATALQVKVLSETAGALAAEARSYLAISDIASLVTDKELADLTAIAEEGELAAAEGKQHSDPDAVFAALDNQQKSRIAERLPVSPAKADLLRARLRGDLRKQTPPPPTPDPGVRPEPKK